MADIESMFYQVKVQVNQRCYQSYIWWPNGDTENKPDDYEMCVHTFGALSSPSCANFALRKTADDSKADFGEDAAKTLLTNFYVDDLLKSVEGEEEAISLIHRLQGMCRSGGFNLTKVV